MPDRRQHDRRESSGINSKKLSISLGNFIMLVVLFIVVIISIILCKFFYSKGFNKGYDEAMFYSYSDDYDYNYSDDYDDSYYDYYSDDDLL